MAVQCAFALVQSSLSFPCLPEIRTFPGLLQNKLGKIKLQHMCSELAWLTKIPEGDFFWFCFYFTDCIWLQQRDCQENFASSYTLYL
jgi:hypothetical protein